jgi:asparagine synthase (glutamine-hydrolysing)
MCGIAGMISASQLGDADRRRVRAMNATLVHRGPDSEGEYRDTHVSLAMRRLSIIDLAGGEQPLYNEDHSIVIVANGEIYNYIELAADLRSRGHHFQSGSDIETIIHLYEDYGAECVQHLRGMFAFALWDSRTKQLLIARDRIGEKPFYLWQDGDSIWFASELKALLSIMPQLPELDPDAIDLFFHYEYVPEPLTPFRTIRKLAAAHRMIIGVGPWHIREEQYWNPLDAPELFDSPAERIRAELETVSQLVIRSDVPVGIALSGGLDSGAVALLSAPKYPETMRAFSVGYPGGLANDERPQARALARQLGIPFFDVEMRTQDLVAFFPKLQAASDDPIADIAAYPQYAVMRLAAEHGVKVMLNGIGGDELFWGYGWVQTAAQKTETRQRAMQPANNGHNRWHLPWHRDRLPSDQLSFYDNVIYFNEGQRLAARAYTPALAEAIRPRNAFRPFTVPQPWAPAPLLLTRGIFDTWLVGNCIALGDRLSMASSVELRLPLVDYRLVEVVFGLRRGNPDHHLPAKAWLKAAVSDLLPPELANRPKRGFTPPVAEWLSALTREFQDVVSDGWLVSNSYFKRGPVLELLRSGIQSTQYWNMVYKLLTFEVWHREISALRSHVPVA